MARTLDIDGANLTYAIEGRGKRAISFVHGWCSHLHHWDAQVPHFAADHRVVRWDRRGMGQSATAPTAESPQRHADDLAAILDHEGIERTVVVGHAGGTPAALAFATAHADRTEALVVVDARLWSPDGGPEDAEFEGFVRGMLPAISGANSGPFLDELYRSFFGPQAPPATVEAAATEAAGLDSEMVAVELEHVLLDTAGTAGEVTCPVLWVSSDPTDAARTSEIFRDPEIGHVVGSGHFLQLEVPDQFNAIMADFLGRHDPGKNSARN